MQTRDWDELDAGLRERVAELVNERSQAEVARLAGTSQANVNRYLKGTRMPAAFCAALVQALDVNPAWLLAGQGSAHLSDVTQGTRRMAGDVLELVQAMNEVTRMRLGSLVGKHHLKVLRELNDTLTNYESLRERMSNHSRDLLKKLIEDMRAALKRLDLVRAQDIRKAAVQVARLCEDSALQRDLTKLEAHIEFLSKNPEASMGYQRKVFMQGLMEGDASESEADEIGHYVLTLARLGRHAEALRIAEAALALFGDRDWGVLTWLDYFAGYLQVGLGDIRKGLARMQARLPQISGNPRAGAEANVAYVLLQAGVLGVPAAIALGADIIDKANVIVWFALWREDADDLELALDYWRSDKVQRVRGKRPDASYAGVLLRALRGQRAAVTEWKRHTPPDTPLGRAMHAIELAQLARLVGRKADALKHHRKAEKLLGGKTTLDRLRLATHHRNALELKAGKMAEGEARRFFQSQAEAGFGCFTEMARKVQSR